MQISAEEQSQSLIPLKSHGVCCSYAPKTLHDSCAEMQELPSHTLMQDPTPPPDQLFACRQYNYLLKHLPISTQALSPGIKSVIQNDFYNLTSSRYSPSWVARSTSQFFKRSRMGCNRWANLVSTEFIAINLQVLQKTHFIFFLIFRYINYTEVFCNCIVCLWYNSN